MRKGNVEKALNLIVFGYGRNALLTLAIAVSLVIGLGPAIFAVETRAAVGAAAAREKRLTSSQAKAFVRGLKVEMSIVLYPIVSLDSTKAAQDAFDKRFEARGSMRNKTRTQIAAMFNEDVEAAFTDRELSDQIVAAVNRYLESQLKRASKS
jgi:hypothetical protein